MTSETKKIAFVLYPGLTPLDLIGPLQVVSSLNKLTSEWQTVVVGERVEPMATDVGISVVPQASFDEVPAPGIVLVPGGVAPTFRQMGNAVLRDYLLSVSEQAEIVGSICTGALILAAAGLLEGRKATTHWACQRFLERLGATYVPERWVEDDKFITSAGVSAGIDMALELVARLTDESTSRFVQLTIEYDPQPPFGGIKWNTVDRDMLLPAFSQGVAEELADNPELRARLLPAEVV